MLLLWLTVIPVLSECTSLQPRSLTSESNLTNQWKIRGPSYLEFRAGCYASLEAITTSVEEVLGGKTFIIISINFQVASLIRSFQSLPFYHSSNPAVTVNNCADEEDDKVLAEGIIMS